MAAQVITALNGLLLKEIDPLKQATYSIGMIQGGTAPNIIADKVELTGMMRNVTAETRQVLAERLKSVSEGIASALGGSAEFTLFEGYPSVYNDPALTDFVAREISAQSARWVSDLVPDLAGQELLIRETQPILGAEDYGFYTQKLPCCFYRVSTGNQAPTHSTRFMVEEPYIKLCTRSLASLAVSYLLGP
nr:peptidase dimerization domain-containing protein [Fournierella massiliensis]